MLELTVENVVNMQNALGGLLQYLDDKDTKKVAKEKQVGDDELFTMNFQTVRLLNKTKSDVEAYNSIYTKLQEKLGTLKTAKDRAGNEQQYYEYGANFAKFKTANAKLLAQTVEVSESHMYKTSLLKKLGVPGVIILGLEPLLQYDDDTKELLNKFNEDSEGKKLSEDILEELLK